MSSSTEAESTGLPRLSLRRNFSWTLVGNVVYAGAQWGTLIVLAKLGSPEVVGQFALGLAVTAPVFMFTNLHLRVALATDARDEYEFSDYVGLRVIATAVAMAMVATVVLLSGYRPETALVVIIIALSRAFEALSDIIHGRLQQHERMDRIAWSMMIKGPMSLLVVALAVWLTGELLWGVMGLAAVMALRLLTYDAASAVMLNGAQTEAPGRGGLARKWAALRPSVAPATTGRLARLSLPLGFAALLLSVDPNIPKYFMQHYHGEAALGIFAAIAYVKVAGAVVVGALAHSATPRLARYHAQGDRVAYRRLLLTTVGIGCLVGVAGISMASLAGRPLLALFYGQEYADNSNVLTLVMVAAAITYVNIFLRHSMTSARCFRPQVPLFAGVACVTAVGCAWLVPTRGIEGAALALLLSAAANLAASAVVNMRIVRALPAAR